MVYSGVQERKEIGDRKFKNENSDHAGEMDKDE